MAGTQVARVAHTFKGVRIFGAESVVVLDGAGRIVSEADSDRRAGLAQDAPGPGGDFSVVPAISAKAAIDAALASLGPEARPVTAPNAEPIIWPALRTERLPSAREKPEQELNALDVQDVVDHYEPAYLVHTRMRAGDRPLYHDTVVSARDGSILAQWNMLQTVVGIGKSQYNGEVPINTTQADGKFKMIDDSRGTGGTFGAMAITNADHGTSAGNVYANDTNTWGDGKQYVAKGSTTNANGQTAAVNAMWGLMNTYDTLKNVFNWLSLDGRNTATYIAAHVNTAYDNAYYSDTCRCMFIGDGSSFNSLGSIDVIGHEMGHGITAATSNLTYSGESGGLNESSSDINGEAVEAYARAGGKGDVVPSGGNDWVMGKEISKTGTPLRWMYRPSKDGTSPDAWSSTLRRPGRALQQRPEQPHVLLPVPGRQRGPGRRLLQQVPGSQPGRDDRHRHRQGLPDLVQGEHDQVHVEHQLRGRTRQDDRVGRGVVRQGRQGSDCRAAGVCGDQRGGGRG